jgi:hypothetical protein
LQSSSATFASFSRNVDDDDDDDDDDGNNDNNKPLFAISAEAVGFVG